MRCKRADLECFSPAEYRFVVACVHEHIYETCACARHVKMARQKGVLCNECSTGPEPHKCSARMIRPAA